MLGINNLQTNYYNHKKQYKETIDKINCIHKLDAGGRNFFSSFQHTKK